MQFKDSYLKQCISITVTHALVISRLDHYMGLLLKNIQKLQMVQNMAGWTVMCASIAICYTSALQAFTGCQLMELPAPVQDAGFKF